MIKKVLKYLALVLIAVTIALASIYMLFSLYYFNKLSFSLIILKNSTFWTITFLLSVIIITIFTFILLKYKYFSSRKLIGNNDRAQSNLFDNQEFMSKKEMYETYGDYDFTSLKNLDGKSGYVVNSHVEKNTLRVSLISNQHAVIFGSSGTGKSLYQAGMTIQCNAVSKAKPSMIINDLAGELYEQHSAQLENNGYNVAVLNLRHPRKSMIRYNPCSYIWDLFHEYNNDKTNADLIDRVAVNINELALTICPDSVNGNDRNWSQGARGILIGCLWGMLEDSLSSNLNCTKNMFTITQISNIINRQREYLLSFLFNRPKTSKVFDYAGMINANSSEKTVDSYMSQLISALSLFLEVGMQFITAETDFDITTITQQPTALFIIIPVEYASRAIIGTMIYTQIYNQLAYESSLKSDNKLDRAVYFILDEFGNMPKMPSFSSWITTCRKMLIFFFIMLQSTKQLDDIYGKEKATIIINNCHCQMFLGASDDDTIQYFQKMFGTYTAITRSQNVDTRNLDISEFKGSNSLTQKSLISKSELQQIKAGEMFTFVIRQKPLHTTLLKIFDPTIQNIIKLGKIDEVNKNYKDTNVIYDILKRELILGEMHPAPKLPSKAKKIHNAPQPTPKPSVEETFFEDNDFSDDDFDDDNSPSITQQNIKFLKK